MDDTGILDTIGKMVGMGLIGLAIVVALLVALVVAAWRDARRPIQSPGEERDNSD